jgi:WD40 repeat protein
LAYSHDGARLITATIDGHIQIWDLAHLNAPDQLRHGGAVQSVQLIQNDTTLITMGDGSAKLWNIATGKERATLPGPNGFAALSPDSRSLAAPTKNNHEAQIWDSATGLERYVLCTKEHLNALDYLRPVKKLSYSPNGQFLAAWNSDVSNSLNVTIWDLSTRQSFSIAPPPRAYDVNRPTAVTFSPDGKTIAVGYAWWWVLLYDMETRQVKHAFHQERETIGQITALAYSVDGTILASGTDKGSVRLWDPAGGQIVALKGHTDAVRAIAFTPDGKTIATASDDRTVRFWDAFTGQERMSWSAHDGPVVSLAFSHDGRMLVSGSSDGTARIWRAGRDPETLAPQSDLDPDDAQSAAGWHRTGQIFARADRLAEAEEAFANAVMRFAKLAESFPDVTDYWEWQALSLCHLGRVLQEKGEHARAAERFDEALILLRRHGGDDHPRVSITMTLASENLMVQARYLEAESLLRLALEKDGRNQPDTYHEFYTQYMLGKCLFAEKRFAEAEPLLVGGPTNMAQRPTPSYYPTLKESPRLKIAEFYDAWGKPDEAAKWRVPVKQ